MGFDYLVIIDFQVWPDRGRFGRARRAACCGRRGCGAAPRARARARERAPHLRRLRIADAPVRGR
jgi:hypothetical protein